MADQKLLPMLAFSDRELVHVVNDHADAEGWITGPALAEVLEVDPRAAGSRLSWLHRFGLLDRRLEKEDRGRPHFRLSKAGKALHDATLSDSAEKVLTSLGSGALGVAALGALMSKREGETLARAARREFRYWDAKRPGGPRR